jgi:hypothetical protein
MKPEIFGLMIILSLISDMIASLFCGMRLLSLRNGSQTNLVSVLALVFFGIFLRGLFHMISHGYGYNMVPLTTAGGCFYWVGRACMTIPCWMMVYQLRGVSGHLVHHTEDIDKSEEEVDNELNEK